MDIEIRARELMADGYLEVGKIHDALPLYRTIELPLAEQQRRALSFAEHALEKALQAIDKMQLQMQARTRTLLENPHWLHVAIDLYEFAQKELPEEKIRSFATAAFKKGLFYDAKKAYELLQINMSPLDLGECYEIAKAQDDLCGALNFAIKLGSWERCAEIGKLMLISKTHASENARRAFREAARLEVEELGAEKKRP